MVPVSVVSGALRRMSCFSAKMTCGGRPWLIRKFGPTTGGGDDDEAVRTDDIGVRHQGGRQ